MSLIKDEILKKEIRKSHHVPNVWVSACAGAGKTRSLINRFLKLLLLGYEHEKILCITYTKAAASEMKIRINRELQKWVICSDEELESSILAVFGENEISEKFWPSLRNLARNLLFQISGKKDSLKISTIHSFCQSLLKQFPFEANVSPDFQIMDDHVTSKLLAEVKLKILNSSCPELRKSVDFLAGELSDLHIHKLFEEIISQRNRITELLRGSEKLYADSLKDKLDLNDFISIEKSLEDFQKKSFDSKANLLHAAQIMVNSDSETQKKRGQAIQNWFGSDCDLAKIEDYFRNFITLKNEGHKNLFLKSSLKNHPELEEILLGEQKRILEFKEKMHSAKIFQLTEMLACLASSLISEFEEIKKKEACLDYADIINLTSNMLANSSSRAWVLYRLDAGVSHILLDEAQDTALEQWKIIEALSEEFFSGEDYREKSLFVVGDEKQSIFSFQGANILHFNEMRKKFAQKSREAGVEFQEIELNKSYRSLAEVLNLVDLLFENQELRQRVTFAPKIEHEIHRKNEIGQVAIWPLIEFEAEEEEEVEFEMIAQEKEVLNSQIETARLMAKKIASMIGVKFLPSKKRFLKASDVMVLVRKRDEFSRNLVRFLKNENVAVNGLDRINLNEQIIIADLCAFAKFVLLPRDDLNLACILKSPIFNLSENDLFELAHDRGIKFLWEVLCEESKFKIIHDQLANLMKLSSETDVYGFFNHLVEILGFRKIFVENYGKEAIEPIDEFLNQAFAYQQNFDRSLQGFISWFESREFEIKRENNALNQLRVMTIHASKGLQSPVVFLVDSLSLNHFNDLILFDDEHFFLSPGSSEFNESLKEITAKLKDAEYSEYLRLLYVGMTRAEDELIIAAYGARKNEKSWYGLIENVIGQKTENVESDFASEVPEEKQEFEEIDVRFLEMNADVKPENQLEEIDETFFHRGKILHEIFQFLPNLQKSEIRDFIEEMLKPLELEDLEIQKIYEKFLLSMEKFPEIFKLKQIKSEFPIADSSGSFFIDRLVFFPDEILIIEFKSDQINVTSAEDLPAKYVKQIENYEKILLEIYEGKKISKAFLWFENASLIYI